MSAPLNVNTLKIHHAANMDEVQQLVVDGWEAIECNGVPPWDHHGPLSHLTGVAIRSYEPEHFGGRAHDPRFVIIRKPDLDCVCCLANRAGLTPSGDQTEFMALVNRVDTNPYHLDLRDTQTGRQILGYGLLYSGIHDSVAAYAGLDLLRLILGPNTNEKAALIGAAVALEGMRRDRAARAQRELIGDHVLLVSHDEWANDVFCSERPCVVWVNLRVPKDNMMFACPGVEAAKALFGPDGMKPFFSTLTPAGCGGREDVGGGPGGMQITWEIAREYAHQLAKCVKKN